MNIKKTMWKAAMVLLAGLSFIACEDDFETIGGNVIGEPGFNAEHYDEAVISAATNDLAPVQTNNLPVHLLGFYHDPVFGNQTSSILTQLSLSATDPEFGNQPVIDSVILNIPLFSSELENDEQGNAQYELDSVYGSEPIRLSVFESNFFMNSYDPETDFEQAEKYFSDLEPAIMSNLNEIPLYENESYEPSDSEIVERTNSDTTYHAPRVRLALDPQFFQDKILDQEGSSELSSMNNFRNYFRGVYLKAEALGTEGTMMLLNLRHKEAGITLYYTVQVPDEDDVDGDGDSTEIIGESRSFKLNLGPEHMNTFDQEVTAVSDSTNLYLKGGEGSMAVIELFQGVDSDGNGVSDELEFLRGNDWLINEANLEFFVNNDVLSGVNEPERLYLYDLDNNVALADYVLDKPGQMNSMTATSNKEHLVPLEKTEDGEGVKYKIRITRHVDNILNKDSTNVRLGLVVAQNVNLITRSAVKQTEESDLEKIPSTSVVTPEGTVLHGPQAQNEEKRLKLNIYYTESK